MVASMSRRPYALKTGGSKLNDADNAGVDESLHDRDFTGGGILALPDDYRGSTGNKRLDAQLNEIVSEWACEDSCNSLVREMIITALKVGRDNTGPGDMKLINRAMKEMRESNEMFKPYRNHRKVVCYGSARTHSHLPAYRSAVTFAAKMRDKGWMAITGAGDGIMGGAQLGAGREHSFGLNIDLPFEQSANETIRDDEKLVTFNYFFTRKLSFVKEGDAFVLFPGGFGTMDEGFEILTLIQTGKAAIQPVILLDEPGGTYWKTFERFIKEHLLHGELISPEDMSLFTVTDSVEDAVDQVLRFYTNFHSYRFCRERMSIRMHHELHDEAVEEINKRFSDLLVDGEFTKGGPLIPEQTEKGLEKLPRLICKPHRNRFGRWRELIDFINVAKLADTVPAEVKAS